MLHRKTAKVGSGARRHRHQDSTAEFLGYKKAQKAQEIPITSFALFEPLRGHA
jgi:hypothetical protein